MIKTFLLKTESGFSLIECIISILIISTLFLNCTYFLRKSEKSVEKYIETTGHLIDEKNIQEEKFFM
ncbi:MAG: prepilin-type N-terminal cleavage/methylation domain-containing protein [Treponema sp.]|nr:prepilin-type N-terminal cleavage/methylation domain-containing protein [Treponema sp.]